MILVDYSVKYRILIYISHKICHRYKSNKFNILSLSLIVIAAEKYVYVYMYCVEVVHFYPNMKNIFLRSPNDTGKCVQQRTLLSKAADILY